jgi:hypothetical protein
MEDDKRQIIMGIDPARPGSDRSGVLLDFKTYEDIAHRAALWDALQKVVVDDGLSSHLNDCTATWLAIESEQWQAVITYLIARAEKEVSDGGI